MLKIKSYRELNITALKNTDIIGNLIYLAPKMLQEIVPHY